MNTQITIVIAAAVLVGVVLLSLSHRSVAAPSASYIPDPKNDKTLLVQGYSPDELKKLLADFEAIYKQDLQEFKYLMRTEGSVQRVVFPNDLEPRLFSFLVNYAQYPKGFKLEGRGVVSVGTATVTPAFGAPVESLGKKAVFYLPTNDQDYDLVYVAVGEKTFRQSFTNMRWKPENDRRMPSSVELSSK